MTIALIDHVFYFTVMSYLMSRVAPYIPMAALAPNASAVKQRALSPRVQGITA